MALWSLVSRAVQFDFLLKAAFDAKAGAFFFLRNYLATQLCSLHEICDVNLSFLFLFIF